MLTYAAQQCDKPGMQGSRHSMEQPVRVYRFVFKSLKTEEAEDLTS